MVGIEPVKRQVRSLVSLERMNHERRERNLEVCTEMPHFVFSGASGTGKSTVARLMGELFASLGLLSSGRFTKVTPNQIISPRIGDTGKQMSKIIKSASDGVLYLGNAPGLVHRPGMPAISLGGEALEVLTTAIEERKGELVVILAGHEEGIQKLFETYPGLRSRIPVTVRFSNYGATELVQIAQQQVADSFDVLDEGAEDVLLEIFQKATASTPQMAGRVEMSPGYDQTMPASHSHMERKIREMRGRSEQRLTPLIEQLGNGRFASNLIERAKFKRAERLAVVGYEDLQTLEATDLLSAAHELISAAT